MLLWCWVCVDVVCGGGFAQSDEGESNVGGLGRGAVVVDGWEWNEGVCDQCISQFIVIEKLSVTN